MPYLKIENPGICPPECYTLLGCSTSRGSTNASVIGQFGSGAKHAISLCLTYGLTPIIYCGNLKLHFYTKEIEVNDGIETKYFDRVYVTLTGTDPNTGKAVNRTEELSWTLQHGSHDWNDIVMALREFISNAIDRTYRQEGKLDNVCIEVVQDNQVRAKKDHTRIFIPYSRAVQEYHIHLNKYFLHFSGTGLDKKILEKTSHGQALIYRKGVYVGTVYSEGTSLFDYNFGEELYIDECRNGKVTDMCLYAAENLVEKSTREQKVKVLLELFNGKERSEVLETTFHYFPRLSDNAKREWLEAFVTAFGTRGVCIYNEKNLLPLLLKKEVKPLYCPYYAWYEFLSGKVGITGPDKILSKDEMEGTEVFEPSDTTLGCVAKVWKFLSKYTEDKDIPPVYEFRNNNFKYLGYYKEGMVYINRGLTGEQLTQTVLEELVHHLTEKDDCTRDLQEFLFMLITRELLC